MGIYRSGEELYSGYEGWFYTAILARVLFKLKNTPDDKTVKMCSVDLRNISEQGTSKPEGMLGD